MYYNFITIILSELAINLIHFTGLNFFIIYFLLFLFLSLYVKQVPIFF